jgi:hypothetical protein
MTTKAASAMKMPIATKLKTVTRTAGNSSITIEQLRSIPNGISASQQEVPWNRESS